MAHRPREDRRTLPAARVRANELWRIPKPFLVDAQNDATLIAIRAQATAGLDIVTDGEIRLWLWPLAYWALSKGLSGSQNGHSVNLEIPSDVSYRLGVRRECVRQALDGSSIAALVVAERARSHSASLQARRDGWRPA